MIRIFRIVRDCFARRTPPAGDEWHVGDLAECVFRGPWFCNGLFPVYGGPKFGERRVVRALARSTLRHEAGSQLLIFAQYPGCRYVARQFRKITPRADEAIAADSEFLGQLIGRPATQLPELVS